MCDPVTIALSAASTLGQSFLQNKAANAQQKAITAAQNTFNQDIQERRNLANREFQNSIQQVQAPSDAARLQTAIDDRIADSQTSFDQKVLLPGQGDATNAVRTAIVQAQNQGQKNIQNAIGTNARLQAFGDADLRRDINLKQNANRISTQGGFAQGALNNLGFDTRAAQTQGQQYTGMADLVGALGNVAQGAYGNVQQIRSGQKAGYDPFTGITWNTARQGV